MEICFFANPFLKIPDTKPHRLRYGSRVWEGWGVKGGVF